MHWMWLLTIWQQVILKNWRTESWIWKQGLKNSRDWEAHKKYIDIHFPLEESELVTVMETALVPGWGEYDEAKERMKAPACEGGSTVTLHPGDFAVTFPEDAHMAGLTSGEEKTIRKVLVKVPV